MEPLVSRPRDQETAGSGDKNVVANGIRSVGKVFIVGLQPRDKSSTLVYKTIWFFSKNLYESLFPPKENALINNRPTNVQQTSLSTITVAVTSAARQGSDTVNYTLNHFPAKNGPDLRLLYCQMRECEHPVLSDWLYS